MQSNGRKRAFGVEEGGASRAPEPRAQMMALVGLFLTHYFCVVMLGDATKVLPREAQLSSAAVNTQARKACPGSQNRVSETGVGGPGYSWRR